MQIKKTLKDKSLFLVANLADSIRVQKYVDYAIICLKLDRTKKAEYWLRQADKLISKQ